MLDPESFLKPRFFGNFFRFDLSKDLADKKTKEKFMDIKSIIKRKKIIGAWGLICLTLVFTVVMLVNQASEINVIASPTDSHFPPSFSQIVKKAAPSVVNISSVTVVSTGRQMPFQNPFGDDPFGDLFERFFRYRIPQMPENYRQTGLGTGFIIDEDGYILTNNHLVESAEEINVTLADKREFEAEIIGRDPKTDLALLRIEGADELEPLTLGDSDKLEVGDWVVAIGNPFGLENTVTAGIVSAKYRRNVTASSYDNYIQTDASINRGNSGGPLMNTKGEVIGINTAIFSSQTGGSIGIGFAIPSNMARDLLPQLKKGKVVRAWLGVMIQAITSDLKNAFDLKDDKGALVADVVTGGPAEKAGFKRGDVIMSFDGKDIDESSELPYMVSSTPVGKTVDVEVLRSGKKQTIKVKLGELPQDEETILASRAPSSPTSLGLYVQELTPELASRYNITSSEGVVIFRVDINSPASEAGLRSGDVILEIDREPIGDTGQFNRKIKDYKEGDTILFLVERSGSTLYLTIKVWE
jgi:serine protease Do